MTLIIECNSKMYFRFAVNQSQVSRALLQNHPTLGLTSYSSKIDKELSL